MFIKEIVIDGFKSYSTRTIIKDFDKEIKKGYRNNERKKGYREKERKIR